MAKEYADVELQAIFNHTNERILKHLEDVLKTFKGGECKTLNMICKFYCDGSQQAHS